MKKNILTIAFSVLALLFVTSAIAQNAKWTKGPTAACAKTSVTISGMVTGLGEGSYYCKITGQYDCVNHGTQTPGSANWSDFEVIVPAQTKDPSGTGGNVKLSVLLSSLCDHANWTFLTHGLGVMVYPNASCTGTPTIGYTAVGDCN